MTINNENKPDQLTDETRQKLKNLSRALLRLHKTLLNDAKTEYEAAHGPIGSPHQYLTLVLDHAHFTWLRKISALIALIDEATSPRREAVETEALALLEEVRLLLSFEEDDEDFKDKYQNALQKNPDAVIGHNDALKIIR